MIPSSRDLLPRSTPGPSTRLDHPHLVASLGGLERRTLGHRLAHPARSYTVYEAMALHPRARHWPTSIPLLLSHGWPGSMFECHKIIPMLSDPVVQRDERGTDESSNGHE